MSANANAMSSLQTVLEDFIGGGLSVNTPNGGFSTVLDPSTGSYKTTIATKNGTSVTSAGVGQTPVGLWQQLTTTTGGNWLAIGVIAIIAILGISWIRGR